MVKFKGFETKAAAIAYKKKHGGMLCHKEKYSRSKRDYELAVIAADLTKRNILTACSGIVVKAV